MKKLIFIFVLSIFGVCSVNAATDYSQPLKPDTRTIALWHMNSILGSSGNQWVVNDPNISSKDLKIVLATSGGVPAASIVVGPSVALGNAVYLNSVPEESGQTRNTVWGNSYETVMVEGWVKIDNMLNAVKNIVETDAAWHLQKWTDGVSAEIGFIVNFSDGSNGQVWVTGVEGLSGQWLHFTAAFDENQKMSLNMFNHTGTYNQTITEYYAGSMIKNSGNEYIYVGWKLPAAFDEIRVSTTTCPAGNLASDINKDCHIDFEDFAELAFQWSLHQ